MSEQHECCGGRAYNSSRTPYNNIEGGLSSVPKSISTFQELDRNIFNLFKSVSRFENLLDTFENGEARENVDSAELETRPSMSVVETYKNSPAKVAVAVERIHQLLDRLEKQFS